MYVSKYFKNEELLPSDVTDISKIDEKLLMTIDEIRELLGVPCTINNWKSGGNREWCGLRTNRCAIGAVHSQHRLGKAADLHPVGMTADAARIILKKAISQGKLKYLGGVELNVSWVHVDVRPRINNKVKYFTA
jgi:uncharacterized protein YcbK (DUF882 family)